MIGWAACLPAQTGQFTPENVLAGGHAAEHPQNRILFGQCAPILERTPNDLAPAVHKMSQYFSPPVDYGMISLLLTTQVAPIMLPNKRKLEQISPAAVVESNLERLLGDDLALVRRTIQKTAQTSYPMVDEVLNDALPKHFPRAIITLGASRLGHSEQKKRVKLAAAIELLHLAMMVHEYIPRGEVPLNEQNRMMTGSAILIGDYCFGQASILTAETGRPEVVAAFADALARLSAGRVKTLIEAPTQPFTDSAILYAAGAEVGALLAGVPRPIRFALREAAASFGEVLTDSETSLTEAILHLEALTRDRPAAKSLTNWMRTHRPA